MQTSIEVDRALGRYRPPWHSVLPVSLLCVVFLFGGAQTFFLWVYAFLLLANALYLVAGTWRWYREMSGLDRARRAA